MQYLSVGTNELQPNKFKSIKNGNPKPSGGLWTTQYNPNYTTYNEWVDYLARHPYILFYKENYINPFLIPAVVISLQDDALIFKLSTKYQLDFLKTYYKSLDNWIDFEKLSHDYDGLYIDIYNLTRELSKDEVNKINSYSVNSLILFNLNCIKFYEKAKIEITPYDFEYENHFINYNISKEEEPKKVFNQL